MSARAVHFFILVATTVLLLGAATAAEKARRIETTKDADYYGFDLRTEKDVSLDTCKAVCLADRQCRAFTYNTKAQWCFLKSDYNKLKPFPGAVAGRVVEVAGEPELGAAPDLAFLPAHLVDEARRTVRQVERQTEATGEVGLRALTEKARKELAAGDPRAARLTWRAAVTVDPQRADAWVGLARADLDVRPQNNREAADLHSEATAAAWQGYHETRTAAARADALAVLARALAARESWRPALEAYKTSLEIVNNPQVRAAYADLKARKGFRVIDNTVDSETASPRACIQLSEDLARGGVDYASFVRVNGAAPSAVEAKDRQICVEGLKHGENYRITLRAGLPAAIGEVLQGPVVLNIYVRDRQPSVRFTGDNFVLPSAMRRGIPVVSVNTERIDLQLFRVGERALARLLTGNDFLARLNSYELSTIKDDIGEPVWKGELTVKSERNKEVTTAFPVDEALPEREPGIYVLSAVPHGQLVRDWDAHATQWFLVSDIGLATFAGQDGLHVFARSLASAEPLAGVELKLLARNNEVLGTATTDSQGRADFTAGLVRGTGGLAPALIAARHDDDFVFLDMTRPGFDLSDRGVAGRAAPGALDVYAWTERGVYRAGETVHATALARDDQAAAIGDLPLTFVFLRPDGVENRRVVSNERVLGGHAVDLDLPENAMRGTWQLRVYADPDAEPVAEKAFLVEDFVPDRVEFDLSSDRKTVAPGSTAAITVDGRYLYGAPAAGLSLEGEVDISTRRDWDAFPGYRFGLDDEAADQATSRRPLTALPVLDDEGKATFDVALDTLPSTTRLLKAEVVVRMREAGGRAVERSIDLPVAPASERIGIRPSFSGDEVPENSTASFRLIASEPDGTRTAVSGAHWSLVKIERRYQWYRQGDAWNYEPVTYTSEVASGSVDIGAGEPAEISVPVEWGRYRLLVETDDAMGPQTSVAFNAGWFVEPTSTETPDALEIGLDRKHYEPGDVAELNVSPRFAGKLLVTVGAERVRAVYTADVPAGGTTLDIPVGEDWGAGAYVTATLFRPGNDEESRMPMRAIGVKWLSVDPGARKLDVTLDTPQKARPRRRLEIPVSVADAAPGEAAYVTVAAVDVGILNLTDYTPPDPDGWYFGQRRLGISMRDLYGRLIDGSAGVMGRVRTGGGGSNMVSKGNPPTRKLVAFSSGPVRLDENGKAVVGFDMPQFNGTVRIMAVAWTRKGVGHAVSDVIVRDPVVVTSALPEFLAPGDQARMRLDLANTDGPAGDYALSVDTTGDLTLGDVPSSVKLSEGGKAALTLPVSASGTGQARVAVHLAGPQGLEIEHERALTVRPAAMPVTRRHVVSLPADGGSISIDRELLADSRLDGASVGIGVSPLAALDVPSLLVSLERYPFGCAEQTVSRAMPLLYVSDLAESAGITPDPDNGKRIRGAIRRVLSYQASSGSFGLWSPGRGNLWLDAYVTDFLTRAREKEYRVPQEAMKLALDNLANALAYETDVNSQGEGIAYALYVLARNRRVSIGDLRYFGDTQIRNFATAMARAQVAAALALYGDTARADRAFAAALELAGKDTADTARDDYGSPLRDDAAMLALAAETRPQPPVVPRMVSTLAKARQTERRLSTQEQAWLVMAARAIKTSGQAIRLTVNGTPHEGSFARRVSGRSLLDRPLTIVNDGPKAVDTVVTAVAAPKTPLPAGGFGFTIERRYYRLDGTETDISQVRQNERFVVVVKVVEKNAWPSHVVVTDLLPGGLRIDNPHLVGSADLANFGWLPDIDAAHTEFRGDRFVAAFDRTADSPREVTMAYVVRAVTPGVYAHPAASVEDMYRPYLSARTATTMMRVEAGN